MTRGIINGACHFARGALLLCVAACCTAACSGPQASDAPEDESIHDEPSTAGDPAESVVEKLTPCKQGYVQRVIEDNAMYTAANTGPHYGEGAGYGQNRYPDVVLGPPRGEGTLRGSLDTLSLGAGGEIVLDVGGSGAFDGEGADFIIFENAFYISGQASAPYVELAEVSVSVDGKRWKTFGCDTADKPTFEGCAGSRPVYSRPDNDISAFDADNAGGNAFDLAKIDLKRARYIRIRDLKSQYIETPKTGFDLDAVAIVHSYACHAQD